MIKAQTLKGFRDFLPNEARKRQYVIDTLKKVFESYGFEPLETPSLEYEEILMGKYGEEGDKLMYRFEDNGKRKVALRYDQTVPLARVVAQYQNELPMPFKRYQIQNVWRAENTQKGRFREFLQCDIDTAGTRSPYADAEIIACISRCLDKLGFINYKILINDRNIFNQKYFYTSFDISIEAVPLIFRAIDKIKKIGKDGVIKELVKSGFTKNQADEILKRLNEVKPSQALEENIFAALEDLGISQEKFEFSPSLVRGLDYYTEMVFEVEVNGYSTGSIAGGGRYDNLIGIFTNRQIPAVGGSFGFDRLMEAMEELKLFPAELTTTKVLITVFSKELENKSLEIAKILRGKDINTEIYLEDVKMEKQLKYADKKQIPYVVIIGPDEAKNNTVALRNMKTREQEILSLDNLAQKLLLT